MNIKNTDGACGFLHSFPHVRRLGSAAFPLRAYSISEGVA